MTRAALLCTMLTSKKHADGISKLIYKADLDKRKGALKDKTLKMEELLKEGWKQVQQNPAPSALKALCFGKFCVRLVLHILSKEKFSRDHPFETVQMIVDQFGVDLFDQNLKASSRSGSSSSKGSGQARFWGGGQGLVECYSKSFGTAGKFSPHAGCFVCEPFCA